MSNPVRDIGGCLVVIIVIQVIVSNLVCRVAGIVVHLCFLYECCCDLLFL